MHLPASTEVATRPVAEARWREPVAVEGLVRSICVQPRAGIPTFEATLWDATGGITLVWLGRRSVGGVRPGRRMRVEGMVGDHHGRLALVNPTTELCAG
jgi:hypothetical protein